MLRPAVALAALLLLALPASASILEKTSAELLAPAKPVTDPVAAELSGLTGLPIELDHLHLQVDGGTEYDAPDTCAESSPMFSVPVGGSTSGALVPVDDEADYYQFEVAPDQVGTRLSIAVDPAQLDLHVDLSVLQPACAGDVTAPENQPAPPPADPAPGPDQQQVSPHNLAGPWTCSDRWFFVMNQFGGLDPPATVHAVWTDGSQADVPLLKDTPATMAQYATGDHLGFTLHSVTANVPAGWHGQFNVGEGPCGAVDGHAVFGEPSQDFGTTIVFTPTQSGPYVAGITIHPRDVQAPPVGTTVPASCHEVCGPVLSAGLSSMTYKLHALQLPSS